MNRSRTNQLLKIEKENENKDIKKRQRTVQSKVFTGVLSNTTTSTTEKFVQLPGKQSTKHIGSKSKAALVTNEAHSSCYQTKSRLSTTAPFQNETAIDANDDYVKSIGIFPNHKKLGPYMASTPGPKPRLGSKQIKRQPKVISLPDIDEKKQLEQEIQLLATEIQGEQCVRQLLTPRNIVDVKDSSSEPKIVCDMVSKKSKSARSNPTTNRSELDKYSTCSECTTFLNLDLVSGAIPAPDCISEAFYVASLLPVPNGDISSDSSATLERKFRNVLDDNRNSMAEDDIKVVKDVLKIDQRHSLLKTGEGDPKLFKEILKSQLEEIIKNERIVKSALKKLGASPRLSRGGGSFEMLEISDMLSSGTKRLSERDAFRKSKRRNANFRIDVPSEEPSPRRNSFFDIEEHVTFSEDSMENQLGKPLSSKLDERYEYSEKCLKKKLKHGKRARSMDAENEYEEFKRSTLPKKQKVIVKKLKNQPALFESESQVNMHLNVDDDNDILDDALKLKPKNARVPQVDVTFKNVPSLEKEILILKALGERLEATLIRTASEPSLTDLDKKQELYAVNSMSSLTKEIQRIDSTIQVFPGRMRNLTFEFLFLSKISLREGNTGYQILARGLRHEIGIVNEFVIVPKTIDELKCDINSKFYIPKSGRLECTSFAKLKDEPEFLMRNLKAKYVGQRFNILDHDSIFFNSLLMPANTIEGSNSQPKMETSSKDSGLTENAVICEGGDSLMAASEGFKKTTKISESAKSFKPVEKKPEEQPEKTVEKVMVSVKPPKVSSKSIKLLKTKSTQFSKPRRNRIRRLVTPMPIDAFDEPKNNLLKKVLIGVVQVSLFLGLIMALILPDIKC